MNQSQEQRLIADIKQILDSQPLDQDSRFALQKARAQALTNPSRSCRQLPWLPFAFTACLIAILAINLPSKAPSPASAPKPKISVVSVNNPPTKVSAKPIATIVEKPVATNSATSLSSADADLLDNLEFYEDVEFYQWLAEQDNHGVADA
ncbi:MAG: hypothetical protein KA902_00325 [Arenimonas sp.]|nr:hypothetical protein [Arenimonas sp.]